MSLFQTFIVILATISLFLYGLRSFSREVQEIGSEHFQKLLTRITRYSLGGFLFGGILTAIIQSSSAVSSITVALVDAGVIAFPNSLAVMLGANVGTTTTAWLVTYNIGQIAPIFIILGTLFSLVPAKIKIAGNAVFYFGLILFSLELISQALEPVKNDPQLLSLLAATDNRLVGILAGIIVTTLVQSSSVTTGLAVILAQQGALSPQGAIAVIIGSNVGTTSTALFASIQMTPIARLAARANFLFNVIGVVVCFPFIGHLARISAHLTSDTGFQVAFAHLLFNVVISILMLPFLKQFANWLHKKKKHPQQVPKQKQSK